jgi:hypothetical protein
VALYNTSTIVDSDYGVVCSFCSLEGGHKEPGSGAEI